MSLSLFLMIPLLLGFSLGRHPCFESITIWLCLENTANFLSPEAIFLFDFCFLLGRKWSVLQVCWTKQDQFTLTKWPERLGLLIINTVAVSLVLSVQNKEQHNYEITGKLQPQIEIISTFKVLWNTFPSF